MTVAERTTLVSRILIGLAMLALAGGAGALVRWGAITTTAEAHTLQIVELQVSAKAAAIERTETRVWVESMAKSVEDIRLMVIDLHGRTK